MVADAPHTLPDASLPNPVQDPDRQRAWFALALPALMAVLLTLVPIIGYAAAGPFALILLPLVIWSAFRDTERAIYVYIAWCWMDGTIRGVFGGGAAVMVARDIVLGIIIVGWGLQRLQNRFADPLRCPPGSLLIALFVINCLLQVFNPLSLGILQNIGGLKLHLSPLPIIFIAYDVFRRRAQVRALFMFLTLATLVIGFVSLVQYVQGQDWTWAHFPGTKEAISQNMHTMHEGAKTSAAALFKPPGTTAFGGAVGGYVGIVFPLTFALLMLSEKKDMGQHIKITLLGILAAFIVFMLINSLRSAPVGAFAAVVISGLLIGGRLRARMLMGVGICLVLGLMSLSFSQSLSGGGVMDRFGSTFSDPVGELHKDRQTFFDDVSSIAIESPMGVGLGRMMAGSGRLGETPDNLGFSIYSESYLGEMLFETGILGTVLITCISISILVRGYRGLLCLRQPNDRFLVASVLGVLLVMFIQFFSAPVLMGPPGSVMFWLLAGLMLRSFAVPTTQTKAMPISETAQ